MVTDKILLGFKPTTQPTGLPSRGDRMSSVVGDQRV